MRIILALSMVILGSGIAGAQGSAEPKFIEYTLISFDDTVPVIGIPGLISVTGTCGIDERGHCDALFYLSEFSSGVMTGTIVRQSSLQGVEILCSVRARLDDSLLSVVGSIYQVHVNANGEIGSGRKVSIDHTGKLSDTIIVHTGFLDDSLEVGIMVRVLAEKQTLGLCSGCTPSDVIRIHTHELLDTYARRRGERSAKKASFDLSFRHDRDSLSSEQLMYRIEVELSENIGALSGPTLCSFTFTRIYSIDTLRITPKYDPEIKKYRNKGDKFLEDIRYKSEYTKEITLVPGQVFKLVIPPDTPSVRGFQIVDTLVLMPRRR